MGGFRKKTVSFGGTPNHRGKSQSENHRKIPIGEAMSMDGIWMLRRVQNPKIWMTLGGPVFRTPPALLGFDDAILWGEIP